MVKNLLDVSVYQEIKNRISSLTPEHKALWGKMNVNQMLEHCARVQQVALGELVLSDKPNFILRIIGSMFRKKYTKSDVLFSKNSPTGKSFIVKETNDFNAQKQKLLATLEKFNTALQQNKLLHQHPFFQKMTQKDWAILQYKHLDHHLRQFGV